jgi:hypothetical protein
MTVFYWLEWLTYFGEFSKAGQTQRGSHLGTRLFSQTPHSYPPPSS